MIAAGIMYVASFLGYAMTAARYFKIQLPLFALTASATAVVGFLVIRRSELVGAAWALVASGIVQATGNLAIVICASRRIQTKRPHTDG